MSCNTEPRFHGSRYLSARMLPIFALLLLQACGGGGGSDPGNDDPYARDVGAQGKHRVCSYDRGLDDDGYRSARVSYPCDRGDGPFPATTLTAGFTNTKEQIFWLADHLTSHGYIVMTMTPTNILGEPSTWKKAHLAGVEKLRSESRRFFSPIFRDVQSDKISVMGYSMGGGGVLLAAGELGDSLHTAVAMAPFAALAQINYANIKARTLILAGANDIVASANSAESYFQSLPSQLVRTIAVYTDADHLQWVGGTNPNADSNDTPVKTRFKVMTTAWLNLHMKDDSSAETYFSGAEHQKHLADDWFTLYNDRP
jgi:dienelactone hydrolase